MSLPIVTANAGQKWDCQACGICCRGSIVPLTEKDLEQLKSQGWASHPDFENQPITTPFGNGHRLAHREDGSCVFLQEDGLCRIHAEHGYETKPTPCRMFPLQLAPQRRHALLTLRCACPTASQNIGKPLETYLDTVQQLARRGELHPEALKPPCLKRGEWRDWDVVEPVLSSLAEMYQDERYPIVRRVVHALQFANSIQRVQLGAKPKRQLQELADAAVESSGACFADQARPSRAAMMLFRLACLDYLRLLPSYVTRESWGERLRLVRAAARMASGLGMTPNLRFELPRIRFADLEAPLGRMSIEVLAPLTRMFATTAQSYLYATANRSGWSIVESVRALSLSLPAGMWMLRWLCARRTPTAEDVATIVVALDRGQGHAQLSSTQHRWRVGALHQIGALESLAIWYAK